MRAARVSLENRVSPRCRLRIDRAPAGEARGQDLKRHQERRDPHEAFVGFFRASGRRGFPEEVPKVPMGFNERSEPGFPQYVWQAGIAVQFVVALDQAPPLRGQAVRQEAEVRALNLVGTSCIARVVRALCHDIHRSAPHPANRLRSTQRSIMSPDIYVRWTLTAILIVKK